jgi:hypothetical protein
MVNYKITFNLDGTGVYINPTDPIHIDALLSWVMTPLKIEKDKRIFDRDSVPDKIPIPITMGEINGHRIFCASALSPEGNFNYASEFYKKSFNLNHIDITHGSPVLTNGKYRSYKNNMQLLLTHKMIGFFNSNSSIKELNRLFKNIRYLGKKSAYGYGKVISTQIEEVECGYYWFKDGKTMRFIPHENGNRFIRATPPYWNNHNKVRCLDVDVSII